MLSAVLLVVLAALGLRVWLGTGGPQLRGSVNLLRGPRAEVRLARDERGIALVEASNEDDAFFALGVLHAQDRPAQLEVSRRFAAGRLCELVGESALKLDRMMRHLGLRRAAERALPHLSARARRLLEAYAGGINAMLDGSGRSHELALVGLIGGSPAREPWSPVDTLMVLKLMGFNLAGDQEAELLYGELLEKIDPPHAALFFDDASAMGPTQIGSVAVPTRGVETAPLQPPSPRAPLPPSTWLQALDEVRGAAFPMTGIGSNSWVVSGARTRSGKPLLANDPHLLAGNPSPFYAARVRAPGVTLDGYTLPGVPAMVIGRNARIAWGVTALMADTQDLFVEKLVVGDPTHYQSPDGPLAFESWTETIKVAGKADVSYIQRASRHGPIVEEDWKGRGALALRWSALDDDDGSFDCLLDLHMAGDFSTFRNAVDRCVAPAVSFTYADVDGHIGYVSGGRIPIRAHTRPLGPTAGETAEFDWVGYLQGAQRPSELDPPSGYVVSANNRVLPTSDPRFIAHHFAPPYRAARIRQLLGTRTDLDLDALAQMHADVVSTNAARLVPLLLKAHPKTPLGKQVQGLLQGWDHRMSADSAAGAFFARWLPNVAERLFDDQMGVLWKRGMTWTNVQLLHTALSDADGYFCDDVATPSHESCDDLVSASIDGVAGALLSDLGALEKWRLDRVLSARFTSSLVGMVPVLSSIFGRTVPTEGDGSTVRAVTPRLNLTAFVVPVVFIDFDLASSEIRLTSTMGQSEQPYAPHFADQVADWKATHPRPFGPVTNELRLQPTSDPSSR